MANAQPIIIMRVHKGGHDGHHGGAWKVAYADFVTAMMAFFLLLWLRNVTTDEQKSGIADCFAPSAASKSESGSGAILSGQSMSSQGARISNTAPPSVVMVMTPPSRERPTDPGDQGGAIEASEGKAPEKREGEQTEKGEQATREPNERELQQKLAEREQKAFAEAAQRLKEVVENVPGLAELKKNILIDNTPEGLRIQLVDQDGTSMFSRGSSSMSEQTRTVLAKIAEVAARLPKRISITGHTDATPFRTAGGYGNWELSADRANASRRVLTDAGLAPDRVAEVSGKAETEPLVKEDPFQPSNRRISIVLLREAGSLASPALPKQFQQALPNGRKPQ
ncbi:MAG: chemotaxis protein MotB [Alphaproteobacteria bacterium]|nr:chemotaxis protein MotB [Alphaproteobacteria bacterium]